MTHIDRKVILGNGLLLIFRLRIKRSIHGADFFERNIQKIYISEMNNIVFMSLVALIMPESFKIKL